MKKQAFLAFFSICLCWGVGISDAHADMKIAHEVEIQKVHFDSSDYKLSSDAKLILDQTITLLARMNESYSLKIMGFTDSHGSDELNRSLSVQRANAVAEYFISKGIDSDRILIQGKGWEQPIASNETEEGRNVNRRVEFKFITPDTTQLKLTASTDAIVPASPKEEEIIQINPQEVKAEELKPVQEVQPAPVEVKPEPQVEKKPAVQSVKQQQTKFDEDEELVHTPVQVSPERRGHDTMLVSVKKRTSYYRDHVYEDRKRGDQGQTYVQVTPEFVRLNGASKLGAADDHISSQLSFRGEAGWVSFLEEDNSTFVVAKGYGSMLRFSDNSANLIAKDQKQFTFGGELGIGHYFHPSVFLQLQSGYGKELDYHLTSGNIELDTDYIWHAGMSAEVVAWRFSREGDIGLDGFFNYYDIARGILNSGSSFGASIFVDYDFLRAGFGISKLNLETKTIKFDTWQFGPNFRAYF